MQTVSEKTAFYIRRGYPLSICTKAITSLHAISIPVILHFIIGLPGEGMTQVLEDIHYANQFPVFGIKLQLLHVLRNTDLATDYELGRFKVLSKEEYLDMLTYSIAHLSPAITIHRVTGDGPKELLLAPLWSLNKREVLNCLHRKMKLEQVYQGKEFFV